MGIIGRMVMFFAPLLHTVFIITNRIATEVIFSLIDVL